MTTKLFLTESIRLEEECIVLKSPCLIMRWNTERPVKLQEHVSVSMHVGNMVESIRRSITKPASKYAKRFVPNSVMDTGERCL